MITTVERTRSVRSRFEARLLIVCSLPLLLALINHEWLFSFNGNVDPWVYFGYFNDLRGHLRTFAGTYYGSRLSWVVPGAVVYRLLDPVLANYVLHLGFCELGLVSLYLILRDTTSRETAFFVTVVTAAYPSFLWSIGWDYVDGAGVTYYLIAMYMATVAGRSGNRRLFLALSGASYAAAIHTNIIWLLLTPLMVTYMVVALNACTVRVVLARVGWFLAGGTMLTAMLAAFNAAITGNWLFFAPSLAVAGGLSSRNPWKIGGYTWVVHAPWLVLPAVMLLVGVWFILNVATGRLAAERRNLFFVIQYLLTACVFVGLEIKGLPVFESQFYTSYLVPPMALALAAVVYSAGRGYVFESPVIACLTTCVALVTYTSGVLSYVIGILPAYSTVWPIVAIAIVIVGLSIGTPTASVAAIAALGMADATLADPRVFLPNTPKREVVFRAVVDTLPLIRLCGSADTRFWYDVTEPSGFVYRAAASTELWNYRLVSEAFPSVVNPVSGSITPPEVGDRILMLSENPNLWRRAGDVLGPFDLGASQSWSRTLLAGDRRIAASCLQVTGSHAGSELESLVPVDSFAAPQDRGSAAVVGLTGDRQTLTVTTNRSRYDWQVRSSAISVHAGFGYSLEFIHSVEDGGLGVSITDEHWGLIANKSSCSPRGNRDGRIRFRADKDSTVRIVLSNCGLTPRVSQFSIKDVRMWRTSAESAPAEKRR